MVFLEIFLAENSGVFCFPVNAINQEVDIGQIFLKLTLVQMGVLVVMLLVEWTVSLFELNEVLCLKLGDYDFLVLNKAGLKIKSQVIGVNFLMRQ